MARQPRNQNEIDRGNRLAERIRNCRDELGLSQPQLAHMAGISLDTLRKIEQGSVAAPSFFIVADLAQALNEEVAEWVE